MNTPKHVLGLAALCLGFFIGLVALPAFAGETAAIEVALDVVDVTTAAEAASAAAVKWQEFAVYVIGLVAAAFAGGWAWVSNELFGLKGKIPLSDEQRAAVNNAVLVGIVRARTYLENKVRGMPDWEVKNKTVEVAASFVLESSPAALSALGITPATLEALIRDKLDVPAPADESHA